MEKLYRKRDLIERVFGPLAAMRDHLSKLPSSVRGIGRVTHLGDCRTLAVSYTTECQTRLATA